MKILQDQFELRGFVYRLLERTSKAAIYAQYLDDELIAYEVVKVTASPERVVIGRVVEAGEYYPGDSSWGTAGFTCTNLNRALELYTILNNINTSNHE